MNTKNDVEVIINGKQYTLSGYESSEYLQKIANHINDKIAEFKEQDGYLRLDTEMKNILLAINLSDEYYKALKDSNDIKKENEEMEKEIFDIKHEMLTMQSELDKANGQIKKLAEERQAAKDQVIRLETELGRNKHR
ncbi:cell division protein ZapA [Clostridium sp. AM27-31LB]|jgi:cell division protein ZapA|uniref:cell division protein ZapA n=1 Tax=Clostridia TaxID=186801 RepID=UPI000E4D4AD2|nr:cell division protein ZapA [Clostridium sp. AM27-31LB]RHT96174.1 cell division protein ZapA [Clostridium sp. AM27-31LB]